MKTEQWKRFIICGAIKAEGKKCKERIPAVKSGIEPDVLSVMTVCLHRPGDRRLFMKETMLQYFQWYTRNDGWLYSKLKKAAPRLSRDGYTKIWMPPAYKGSQGSKDEGYAPYDLYDIGEFRQKGTVRTRYGTLEQYKAALDALHRKKIDVIADIVFNHRMGGDRTESVRVREVDPFNRNRFISEPFDKNLYTIFSFPGRHGTYSQFVWNSTCFKAADEFRNGSEHIFLFEGKKWDEHVSHEQGNYDYIMGMDVDTSCPWVRQELKDWGRWYTDRFHINGYRLDAIKSIDAGFFPDWLADMRKNTSVSNFAVGEYWSASTDELRQYLNDCGHSMRLFDVPLHYNLHNCSRSQGNWDVRHLLDGTLSRECPEYAVAFVDNHDTQPTQALESWVMDWFKTSAYAVILLGPCQVPCVFLGDTEGIRKTGNQPVALLEEMVWIRSHLLGEDIEDLCDEDPQKACWITHGNHPVLVLFTIGDAKSRQVNLPQYACCTFSDISRENHLITLDEYGNGTFDCAPGCCSVYILKKDERTMKRKLRRRFLERKTEAE